MSSLGKDAVDVQWWKRKERSSRREGKRLVMLCDWVSFRSATVVSTVLQVVFLLSTRFGPARRLLPV